MKIPFSPPYIDDNVINEVVDSLKSGWITTGPKVKALEEVIEKRNSNIYAIKLITIHFIYFFRNLESQRIFSDWQEYTC